MSGSIQSSPAGVTDVFPADGAERSVPDCFETSAAKYPDRVAIADPTGDISYRQLNRRANRLARAIRERCADDAGATALLFEHGAAPIGAALATSKAGRTYVPLDPQDPPSRHQEILADADVSLVVTCARLASTARALAGRQRAVIDMDALDPDIPDGNLGLSIAPDAICAIFYTSGTTGDPKGVVHTHEFCVHQGLAFARVAHLASDDRAALIYRAESSAFVPLVLGPLTQGAALHCFDLRAHGLPPMADWLTANAVTNMTLFASVYRQFMSGLPDDVGFPSLRTVVIASEASYANDVALWRRHFPPASRLVNLYASTEAGLIAHHEIVRIADTATGRLPAGAAVEGKKIYLTDDDGKDVGPGRTGEIVVESRYLASGYWNRPDLTRAIYTTLEGGSGSRLCRTGDLGRFVAGGGLEVLGRADDQVKIHGNRVDPQDVEAALLGLKGVTEATVVARADGRGGHRLDGFVVQDDNSATIGALRADLAERLPRAMIPSRIVRIPRLPRLPNGKIDRRSLHGLAKRNAVAARGSAVTSGSIEEKLQSIIQQVLRVDWIGVDDDLFECGADSLTAIEIIAAIESELGVELPLETLWSGDPTIAGLARVLRGPADDVRGALGQNDPERKIGYRDEVRRFALRDVHEALLLGFLRAIALTTPERRWRAAARWLGAACSRLLPRRANRRAEVLARFLEGRKLKMSPRSLECAIQGAVLEQRLRALAGWGPEAWRTRIRLEGGHHLDEAIAAGRGAILWVAPTAFTGMVASIAVRQARHPVGFVSRPTHGFSDTGFGGHVLNRAMLRGIDRQIDERIVIKGDGKDASDRILQRLRHNKVVAIEAGWQTDRPVVLPFLAGEICLSLGPPRLAVATGAALLPVFIARDRNGDFTAILERPLRPENGLEARAAAESLLEQFVSRFEEHVVREPTVWIEWEGPELFHPPARADGN